MRSFDRDQAFFQKISLRFLTGIEAGDQISCEKTFRICDGEVLLKTSISILLKAIRIVYSRIAALPFF
jgi:hypothetical protein